MMIRSCVHITSVLLCQDNITMPAKTVKIRVKASELAKDRSSMPLKPSMTKAVRKLAKSVVKRSQETKFATHAFENNIPHNSAIGAADLLNIVPPIPQGVDDYQRLGDSIVPTRLTVRGMIAVDRNYSPDNRVLLARVLILSAKNAKSYNLIASGSAGYASELLKPNLTTGTSVVPFAGNQQELFYPVNKDLFTVHYDKVFKISPCVQDGAAVEENPSSVIRWSKRIKLPAKLLYDQASPGNVPTNFAPFYAIGYAYADGTGPDVVATRLITNTQSTMYYKDA